MSIKENELKPKNNQQEKEPIQTEKKLSLKKKDKEIYVELLKVVGFTIIKGAAYALGAKIANTAYDRAIMRNLDKTNYTVINGGKSVMSA